MAFYFQPLITEGHLYLDEEESRHAVKVLRTSIGDSIKVTDGKGNIYQVRISKIKKASCHFEIVATQSIPKKNYSIHLCVAPTKNLDRMEWMVEKLTEIGVDEISFMICRNSERDQIKLDRLQKKAISALKQSKQSWLPKLGPAMSFSEVLDFDGLKFIAHKTDHPYPIQRIPTRNAYKILIGPEGDFTKEEIEIASAKGFQTISLGDNVLRTETAAVAGCLTFHFIQKLDAGKQAVH